MSLAAVLDACTDDTLITIAVALSTPADLLRLALTCRAAARWPGPVPPKSANVQ